MRRCSDSVGHGEEHDGTEMIIYAIYTSKYILSCISSSEPETPVAGWASDLQEHSEHESDGSSGHEIRIVPIDSLLDFKSNSNHPNCSFSYFYCNHSTQMHPNCVDNS